MSIAAEGCSRRHRVCVQDGLAAVHWAAMKGHRDILAYLVLPSQGALRQRRRNG